MRITTKRVCLEAGKMARSPDWTPIGTTETPEALQSPPMASREPHRLLSPTPFQSYLGNVG